MISQAGLKTQSCVKNQAQRTDDPVCCRSTWRQASVHRVMGNNEQPGVQKSSQENQDRCQQRRRPTEIEAERKGQGEQPDGPDQTGQLQSPMTSAEDVSSHPV